MKYLWTEDTGAGLHFWQLINQLFFDNELAIESKESNQGILDALSDLEIKADDKYYIAFDYVVDNQDIRNKYRMLKSISEKSGGTDTYTNLSHDIRTPLTSLDGYFQLMEECENIEDQKRYLSIIHERIHSLNEMLEELFMFTKLKNESYSLELTLCCMNRILKETVFSYYDEWVRMEIQPDIQITEEQLYIHGNRQGLRRVIQNVIKNGLDHGEKKISIVLERDQNQAVLRISNQVTHPEQINIDQVFERFYKADVARSKTSTGLGLSIAKELVSRMDGEIEAKIEKKEFIVEMNFPIVTDAK